MPTLAGFGGWKFEIEMSTLFVPLQGSGDLGDLDHQKRSGTCLGPSVLRTAMSLFETGKLRMFSGKLREKKTWIFIWRCLCAKIPT